MRNKILCCVTIVLMATMTACSGNSKENNRSGEITARNADTRPTDSLSQAENQTDFKDEWLGTYRMYDEYVVFTRNEDGSTTIDFDLASDDFQISSADISVKVNDNVVDMSSNEGKDYQFTFSSEEDRVECQFPGSDGSTVKLTANKTDIVRNLPTSTYISHDSEGTYGPIPMHEADNELFLVPATEDYVIKYRKESTFEVNTYKDTDTNTFIVVELYSLYSYNELGVAVAGNYKIVCQNEADATTLYEDFTNEDSEYVRMWGWANASKSENIVYCSAKKENFEKGTMSDETSKRRIYDDTKDDFVYGEHYYQDSYNEVEYWFSKPFTIQEGELINSTPIEGTYSKADFSVEVEGNLLYYDLFYKVNGNIMSPYKYKTEGKIIYALLNSPGYNVSTVLKLDFSSSDLVVTFWEYDSEEITLDNFASTTPTEEKVYEMTKTE